MLAANTLLQNRYRVTRQLSHGGMGAVYEAVDERVSTVIALKETFAQNQVERDAFEREAKLLANLDNAAFPRVMDHFIEGDGQFLVMQFIKGDDLQERLKIRGTPFPALQVLEWADQLLDALEDLHAYRPPIIHRDIKPANLKLNRKGRVILLDFGIAKGAAGQMSTLETEHSLRGYTPNYAPPEQVVRADRRWVEALSVLDSAAVAELIQKGTDARSDLYSLGATLYHLMTNEVPTAAPTRALALWSAKPDPLRPANQVNSLVPPQVAHALAHSMALDRNQRPSNASAMRNELRECLKAYEASLSAAATTPRPLPQKQPASRNNASTPAIVSSESAVNLPMTAPGPTESAQLPAGTIQSPFTPSPLPKQVREPRGTHSSLLIPEKRKTRWGLLAIAAACLVAVTFAVVWWFAGSSSVNISFREQLSAHSNTVRSVAFSPDGKMLASGSADQTVILWEAGTGKMKSTLRGHSGAVNSVAFSADSNTVAGGGDDGTTQVWDAETGRQTQSLSEGNSPVKVVAFSPRENTLACGSDDGVVRVWNAQSGVLKMRLSLGSRAGLRALAFSPDGEFLAGGGPGEVGVWETQQWTLTNALTGYEGTVLSVSFSSDNRTVAGAADDGRIRVWDGPSGKLKNTISAHSGAATSIFFASSGKTIISGGNDGTVRFWDPDTGQSKAGPLKDSAGAVLSVSASSDLLASANQANSVTIWKVSGL